jgi:hypothetical protein
MLQLQVVTTVRVRLPALANWSKVPLWPGPFLAMGARLPINESVTVNFPLLPPQSNFQAICHGFSSTGVSMLSFPCPSYVAIGRPGGGPSTDVTGARSATLCGAGRSGSSAP